MCFVSDELDQTIEGVAKALEKLAGSRMLGGKLRQHLARLLAGIDELGNPVELRLILMEVREGDLEQPGQRCISHFVIPQLPGERVGARMRKSPCERGRRSLLSHF